MKRIPYVSKGQGVGLSSTSVNCVEVWMSLPYISICEMTLTGAFVEGCWFTDKSLVIWCSFAMHSKSSLCGGSLLVNFQNDYMVNLLECNAKSWSGFLLQKKKKIQQFSPVEIKFQQFSPVEINCFGPVLAFSKFLLLYCSAVSTHKNAIGSLTCFFLQAINI